jgi:hypothetical protein
MSQKATRACLSNTDLYYKSQHFLYIFGQILKFYVRPKIIGGALTYGLHIEKQEVVYE